MRSNGRPGQVDRCDVGVRGSNVHNVESIAHDPNRGTQAVRRAATLLRLVASAAEAGSTLSDLAEAADLSRPTAHRLLSALKREGLVDQDESSRWVAGVDLYLMGRVAATRYDVTDIARDIVRSLAVRTEESAFLSVRRGDETVCILREEGSFPIRSFVLHEGARFPLGVASAGLAILAFMDDHDVDAYFRRHPELGSDWGEQHSERSVRRRLMETKSRGFAFNPGLIVEGSNGVGAAVFNRAGEPQWALSLTGVHFRLNDERLPEVGRLLLAHAHELTLRIGKSGRFG